MAQRNRNAGGQHAAAGTQFPTEATDLRGNARIGNREDGYDASAQRGWGYGPICTGASQVPHSEPPSGRVYSPATQTVVAEDGSTAAPE